MKILVINCGSSSVKCKLFQVGKGNYRVLAAGVIEKIAEGSSVVHLRWPGGSIECEKTVSSHRQALEMLEQLLLDHKILADFSALDVIAHRVVHGGEKFHQPVVVNNEVIETIKVLIPLAPLHNPFNLEGIMVLREKAPRVEQVAIFDTAFHQTMPEVSYLYALPYDLYRKKNVRRYGFHGISHSYLVKAASRFLAQNPGELNAISLHLGNGASAAAVKNGRSVDTSMGMTPMEGLVMGTRSGDVDPGILVYLERECGLDGDHIDDMLNTQSGLKGLCAENDMREIVQRLEKGDEKARIAFEVFCYRLKKYIGAYAAVLGRVDVLIFSGGIGAYSPEVREKVCEGLDHLGISLDVVKNKAVQRDIDRLDDGTQKVKVLRIVTDEELEMAQQAAKTAVSQARTFGKVSQKVEI
ncbi:MAG: acetate/propionate family kinase [Xanthomonadaceae bacterium]|nr:acetate/propionate family kinase [Xanthomonadaceae bacterium]